MGSIKSKIGGRIRELRKKLGYSQQQLADLAGLDRTYINSVENGRRNISIVNLEKILLSLKIGFSDFFGSDLF